MITAAWMGLQLIGVLLIGIAPVTGALWWLGKKRGE